VVILVVAVMTAAVAAARPRVPSAGRHVALEPNGSSFSPDQRWPIDTLRLPAAWDVTTGGSPGPLVAIVDTGVAPTADLAGRVEPGVSYVGGTAASDENGHGTLVAGIVAAAGNDGVGLAGVCWSCRILPLRVGDADGYASSDDIAAAVDTAVSRGAAVINLSLGSFLHTDRERAAVGRAVAAGVVVVAAAGNDGSSVPSFPAAYAGVVAVGAVGADGKSVEWSNHGPWVSVEAPACGAALGVAGDMPEFCGTSAASPFVAGVAALLKAARPAATGADIVAAIQRSARPADGSAHGVVDAAAALAAIQTAELGTSAATKQALLRVVQKPQLSGVAMTGATLSATTGSWSGSLTSIATTWQRCTAKGTQCRVVARGKLTYRIKAGDRGRAIRVVIRAVGEDAMPVEAPSRLLVVRR
jgi:subtilisin family serine protease